MFVVHRIFRANGTAIISDWKRAVSYYTKLQRRCCIEISGPDTIPLLQGLLTNDLRYFEKESGLHAMYALMLNNRGRILYDMIVYKRKCSSEETSLILECDLKLADEVLKQLKIFRLRRKCEIVDKKTEYALYHVSFSTENEQPVWKTTPLISSPDPRCDQFGWRLLLPSSSNIADFTDATEVPEAKYDERRYEFGIAESSNDLPPGAVFPLESNGDYLNGISFHKGCYVGQELTARTHHTGVVRKRLMPLEFKEPITNIKAMLDSQLIDEAENNLGKFRNGAGKYGIGLLRIEKIGDGRKQLGLMLPGGEKIACETWKPFWWSRLEVRGFQPNVDA